MNHSGFILHPSSLHAGLYVHVPFCFRKCPYCDFYSLETRGAAGTAHAPASFLDALEIELAGLPDPFEADTIFIGGGTPTELATPDLERLLRLISDNARARPECEWTCEANPGTLTEEKARLLKAYGVNRISLGVQALQDERLKQLGRIHSAAQAIESIHLLRRSGFDNLNLDLMYGYPGLTSAELEQSLERLIETGPEHLACYALSIEPNTPFGRRHAAGALPEESPEAVRRQYDYLRARLTAAGYQHYELSNFCRPGFPARHNLLYWTGGATIGCGPAAHSCWNGARYANIADLETYAAALRKGRAPRAFEESLEPEPRARELLMLNLRLLDGVDLETFRTRTGFDALELGGEALAMHIREGFVVHRHGRLRLAEKALFVSDAIFRDLADST